MIPQEADQTHIEYGFPVAYLSVTRFPNSLVPDPNGATHQIRSERKESNLIPQGGGGDSELFGAGMLVNFGWCL